MSLKDYDNGLDTFREISLGNQRSSELFNFHMLGQCMPRTDATAYITSPIPPRFITNEADFGSGRRHSKALGCLN